MAKTSKILQSFNKGELTPLVDMRIDQQAYQMGCRTMENFYPLIYGGAERRQGTYYVAAAKDGTAKIRMIDFVFSVDQAYILEFGNQYIRIYLNNGRFVGLTAGNNSTWTDATKYYAGDFAEGGTDGDIYRCLITHTSDDDGGNGTGGDPDSDGNSIQWVNCSVDAWATGQAYTTSSYVSYSSVVYKCKAAHTSATGGGDGGGGEPDTNTTQWIRADATNLTSDMYPIYEIPSPYLTADLFELKLEQSADVMYITHPQYEPRKLSRYSTTTFVLEELNYQDGPFQDINTVTTAIITPSATTGTITLTASGTNADGTTFEPFQSGTGMYGSSTAGHSPSGSTGDANAGTSQTNPSITGALFKLLHALEDYELSGTFTAPGITDPLLVYKGVTWDFVTKGTWGGTILIERSYDWDGSTGTWETIFTVVSQQNNNVQVDGTEEIDDAYYRIQAEKLNIGTAGYIFSVRDSSHIGIAEIVSVTSGTVATATVTTALGSTDGTHRWAEGYWSNYRGWPNCVAISSEERLTFAGSPSFPLTVWGSVSGDYTSMRIGILDDDAIIFTLVGSGRQNSIRWIVSKNLLVLGTYGGEHTLGASGENEALTPTNVRAQIHSTYGSEDIQALVVGNAILYVQRGGRRLREMHYDFAEESQVSEDLTVFANHISEGTIDDMAYQRTPDPMLWCVRGDGQMAVLSYERAQDVWSWCRIIIDTNDLEGDFESVAIIPTSGEEDQVWFSAYLYIPSSPYADGDGYVRYIAYFTDRDF